MKLWDKNHQEKKSTISSFEKFCMGNDPDMDLYLAKVDLMGTLAHAQMLSEQKLLNSTEFSQLKIAIHELIECVDAGEMKIAEGVEDIHSQIEFLLTERLGDIGKKIHSGRSRNDQSLLDIKLYLKTEIKTITKSVTLLFDKLMSLAYTHQNSALPGYTHWQVAMPSSFGLWFSGYAESLSDDLAMLYAAYKIANKNPLGSGAGYGSTFPINRKRTTELLGMESMHYNSMNAQLSRGKTEKWMAMAIATIAATLSRFSNDVCIYNAQNFKFINVSETISTGSSIMPHKRNPDVFELLRARFNILQTLPNDITILINNLPSGYHRDMQLTKELLFPAIHQFKECLEIVTSALDEIIVNENSIDNPIYYPIYSVERINELVIAGMPFRDAYKKVANEIEKEELKRPANNCYTHEGSIGNLCLEEIKNNFMKCIKLFE